MILKEAAKDRIDYPAGVTLEHIVEDIADLYRSSYQTTAPCCIIYIVQ